MTPILAPAASADGLTLIHRQVSFTVAAFDRLKDYQRHLERTERRRFTNGEVLDRVILAADLP